MRFFLLILGSFVNTAAWANSAVAVPPPPPGVSTAGMVQMVFSLLLVLAAIFLVAWMLKRMNLAQHGNHKLLKVLDHIAVGQRERIVLLEVNNTCVVVGIGPNQMRTLHTFDKPDNFDDLIPQKHGNTPPFSQVLSTILKNKKQA